MCMRVLDPDPGMGRWVGPRGPCRRTWWRGGRRAPGGPRGGDYHRIGHSSVELPLKQISVKFLYSLIHGLHFKEIHNSGEIPTFQRLLKLKSGVCQLHVSCEFLNVSGSDMLICWVRIIFRKWLTYFLCNHRFCDAPFWTLCARVAAKAQEKRLELLYIQWNPKNWKPHFFHLSCFPCWCSNSTLLFRIWIFVFFQICLVAVSL